LLGVQGMNSTVRGIGIRAVILIIGIILVGVWLVSLALKIAGAAIHFLLIVGLLLVVAAVLSYVAHRFKRRP
jgi:high-affinity Fe2+/Pb2+ permease